ncbi:helix-turn-helix transcriptional regulator [Legionella sp. W05-934-2]|uniref:helix-turn-helix transcriptional regulator n=1 Tax=Legionella TaxID=445 RepID=UPI00346206B4
MTNDVIKNHVMTKYGRQFGELCRPIFNATPINYIGFARLYKDGSRSYLISNPNWGEVLLKNNYHLAGTEDALIQGPAAEHQLWSISSMFSINQQTENLFKDCVANNYGNGITLLERGKDCVEFFHICADSGYESVNPYLENNIDQLWNHILHLKEVLFSNKELKDAYNLKYYYDIKERLSKRHDLSNNLDTYHPKEIKKYYLGGNFGDAYFTQREIDCLKLIYQNYNAKEQAKILQLSHRTIECHLEKIKQKAQCASSSRLIIELANNNAFRSLFKV